MYRLGEKSRLLPLMPLEQQPTRRQDAPILYLLNGAVYVVRTEVFRQQRYFDIFIEYAKADQDDILRFPYSSVR